MFRLLLGKYPFLLENKDLSEYYHEIFYEEVILSHEIIKPTKECRSLINNLFLKDHTKRVTIFNKDF